jgi:hypothetical protein
MALPYICQNISKSPTTVKFSEKSRNKHRFNHFQVCPLSSLHVSMTKYKNVKQKTISKSRHWLYTLSLFVLTAFP